MYQGGIIILVIIAISLAIGIIIGGKTDLYTAFIFYFSFITSLLISKAIFKRRISKIIINLSVVFLGIVLSILSTSYETNQLYPIEDKFIEISGYVYDKQSAEDGEYSYIIKTDGAKYLGKIYNAKEYVRLKTDIDLEYGQNIGVRGFLQRFNDKMNSNSFDYSLYYKSKNIFYKISDFDVASDNTLRKLPIVINIKSKVKKFINSYTSGDDAAILRSITTGDRHGFSDDFKKILQKTGCIRFLYSAHLHIMIIFLFIHVFLSFLKRKMRENLILIILVLYALFNLDKPALLRTALTSFLAIITVNYFGYKHFPDILSIVIIVLLVSNPLFIYNAGFVISVVLAWVFYMIGDFVLLSLKKRKCKMYLRYFVMCFITTVTSIPILAYYFDGIAPYTAFFSFILFPIVAVIIVLFPMLCIEMMILGKSLIFSKGILFSIYLFKKIPYLINLLPGSSVLIGKPRILTIILFYLSIIVIKDIIYKKHKTLRTQTLCAILIGGCISMLIISITNQDAIKFNFVNVGQGDACLIELADDEIIIIDGGGGEEYSDYDAGEKIFLPYLLKKGISRIDLAVVSHYHKDHCLGVISAMKNLNVQAVAIPKSLDGNKYREEIERIAKDRKIEIIYIEKGDTITFQSGAQLSVLSAKVNNFTQENDTSVVLSLKYKDFDALFTGDASKELEYELLSDFTDVDLLKVAHHGSSTSTSSEFLNVTKPEYAVIGVGENNGYALPDEEVIDRLNNLGTQILRTDKNGDITIKISKNSRVTYSTLYENNY